MLNTIFHIDETIKWATVISNLHHMAEWMSEEDEEGTIELLVNGEAVNEAKETSAQDLGALLAIGVDVRICKNSMSQRKIEANEIQAGLKFVPSGVVELALKQSVGYGYIKP